MAGDPADVGSAPEDVVVLQVEGPFRGQRGMQQVAAGAVLHTLGLAGGAAGVEQEQRMLGTDPFGLAGARQVVGQLVHPAVTRLVPGDVAAGALVDHDVLQGLAAAQRDGLVDDGLQRQLLAPAQLLVGGDDHHRAGVLYTVAHRLRREAAEDHRVDRADARAGLHRNHALDAHRHVDDDAIALFHAARAQAVGHLAGARQQFLVGDARDLAVVGLEDDGHLVALAGFDVSVQTVVGHVQRAVLEPLEERRLALVEYFRERCLPGNVLTCQFGPEAFVVGLGLLHQGLVGRHARHPGALHRGLAWRVDRQDVVGRRCVHEGLLEIARAWACDQTAAEVKARL